MLIVVDATRGPAPMQVDPTAYRSVMSRFATGVTVLTTNVDGRAEVMTANAVTSVSLDPVLLLVSVARDCRWRAAARASGGFVVNVLSERQAELSRWCAGSDRHADPSGVLRHPSRLTAGGSLVFDEALASFDCRLYSEVAAGDHDLLIGEVQDMWVGDAEAPLLFFGGGYASLGAPLGARELSVAACS
jgi:3-hydroxy-9,10-secoandrosta-1,3,5(10)-triene-9,17-dione monooxygenase reductase component